MKGKPKKHFCSGHDNQKSLPGYVFDDSDANFRVATIDPKKFFFTTIYATGSWMRLENIKQKFEKSGLLYISHAMFSGRTVPIAVPPAVPPPPYNSPAGDIVGYKKNILDYNQPPTKNKVIDSRKNWEKRWYFGIDISGNMEIRHPASSDVDFIWDGYDRTTFDANILNAYRLIMHGGIILFDENDSKLKLPTTLPDFKANIIQYNDNTWQSTNLNAWDQIRGANILPRIAIGLDASGNIVLITCGQGKVPVQHGPIGSRGGMKVFDLAKKMKNLSVKKALLFDSSWPVGIWACPQPEKPFPQTPNGIARDASMDFFAVFQVRNACILKVHTTEIPLGDLRRSSPVPVTFPHVLSQQFTIRIKITKSDFLKRTKEVRLYLMSEKAYQDKYCNGIEPGFLEAIGEKWTGNAIPFSLPFLDWSVPDMLRLFQIIQNDPNRRLVIVLRSQTDPGWDKEIVFEHVLPINPTPAVRTLFFMDNSNNIQGESLLISKRNESITRMSIDAFLRKVLPGSLGTYCGFPTFIGVAGFYFTYQTPYWKDNKTDLISSLPSLDPNPIPSDYNLAFKTLIRYGLGGANIFDKLSVIFFAAGPHTPENESADPDFNPAPVINDLKNIGVILHTCGYRLSPAAQNVLDTLASGTGGKSKSIAHPNDLEAAFREMYSLDQNEQLSEIHYFDLSVGGTTQKTSKILCFGVASFTFSWNNYEYVSYQVKLKTPSGQFFTPGQTAPAPVRIDTAQGYVVITVSNPTQFNTETSKEWKIQVKRLRAKKTKAGKQDPLTLRIDLSDQGYDDLQHFCLYDGMVPQEHVLSSDLFVAVKSSLHHLNPEQVYFMAKHHGDVSYRQYPLDSISDDPAYFSKNIPKEHLKTGILKSYFMAVYANRKITLPVKAPDHSFVTNILSPLQMIPPDIPQTLEKSHDCVFSLYFPKNYLNPEAIQVFFKYQENAGFMKIELMQQEDDRNWIGIISRNHLNKTGVLEIYFLAQHGDCEAVFPGPDPGDTLKITIIEISPVYFPWTLDIVTSAKINDQPFYRAALSLRNHTGDIVFQGKEYLVPSRSWYGGVEGIEKNFLFNDHFDNSIWIYHKKNASGNSAGFALTQVYPDGTSGKEIFMNRFLRFPAFNHMKNDLVGVDAIHMNILCIQNLQSNETQTISFKDSIMSLYPDPLTGKLYIGFAQSGLHLYLGKGKTKSINASIKCARILYVKSNGEFIIKGMFPPDPSKQLDLALLTQEGKIKFHVNIYGLGLEAVYDNYSGRIWLMDDVNNPRTIYCFNDSLRALFCIDVFRLGFAYFHSIAFDPVNGGIWVSCVDSQKKGALGYIDDRGCFEKKAEMKMGGTLSVFRDTNSILTCGKVPCFIYKDRHLPLSIRVSNPQWIPDKVCAYISSPSRTGHKQKKRVVTLQPKENGLLWEESISQELLQVPQARIYFKSGGANKTRKLDVFYPRGAPARTLDVHVDWPFPNEYLWGATISEFGINQSFFKGMLYNVSLKNRKRTGHNAFGPFNISKNPSQTHFYADDYFAFDPLTGNAWLIEVHTRGKKEIFELVCLSQNGKQDRFPIGYPVNKMSIDSVNRKIYCGGTQADSVLIRFDINTKKWLLLQKMTIYSLGVNPELNSALVWGWNSKYKRGLYRFHEDQSAVLLFASQSLMQHLQGIPGGEIICSHDYNKGRRVLRLSSEGEILAASNKHGLYGFYHYKLRYDERTRQVILLTGRTGGEYILRCDLNFNILFLLSLRNSTSYPMGHFDFIENNKCIAMFQSFITNPNNGSLIVLGLESGANAFMGIVDSKQRFVFLDSFPAKSTIIL